MINIYFLPLSRILYSNNLQGFHLARSHNGSLISPNVHTQEVSLSRYFEYDWNLDFSYTINGSKRIFHIEQLIQDNNLDRPLLLSFLHHNIKMWIDLEFDIIYVTEIILTLRIGGYIIDVWQLLYCSISIYGNNNITIEFLNSNKINLNIKYSVLECQNYIKLKLPTKNNNDYTLKKYYKYFDIPIYSDESLYYFKKDYRYALIYLSKNSKEKFK